jgi:hypothetical protein
MRPGATPWRGQPWSASYVLGMHVAVLYESRHVGEHHRVDPYMNAQAAFDGEASCECVECSAGLS